jgi:hypothetical protein
MNELTDFAWEVAEGGHKWMRGEVIAQPSFVCEVLTHEHAVGIPYPVLRYSPLHGSPGLFKNFAELQIDRDSIKAFADKYGMLGEEKMVVFPSHGGTMYSGELRSFWEWQIVLMREALSIWEAIKAKDEQTLSKVIKWSEKKRVNFESETTREIISSEQHHPELLLRIQNPFIDPARYWIQDRVNRQLEEHGVYARLLWNTRRDNLGLHVVPKSLIGCLWLQLANAIAGAKEFRSCPECHKWFDISRHTARVDKKFCTPSCKAAAHRRKPEEARRLKSDGMTIAEIAKKLQTNASTIKNWLKGTRRGKE